MIGAASENALEHMLAAAQKGELSQDELMGAFLKSTVFILLDQAPGHSGILGAAQPLVCQMSDGNDGVAVFTSRERSPSRVGDFDYLMQTRFPWVVEIVRDGIGLAINPGHLSSFEFPPIGVSMLQAMIGRDASQQ